MNRPHGVKPHHKAKRRGRRKKKNPGILFKFKKDESRPLHDPEGFLRDKSHKEGKTMLRFVTELLEFRARFKDSEWPPKNA